MGILCLEPSEHANVMEAFTFNMSGLPYGFLLLLESTCFTIYMLSREMKTFYCSNLGFLVAISLPITMYPHMTIS